MAERSTVGSQKEVHRRYVKRTVVGVAAYIVILVPVVMWLNGRPDSAWRLPVALLPVLPIGFGLWNIRRFFREADELQKRIQLESVAFAFAGSSMAVLTYGFLEMAGFPYVSAWWVWTVMGGLWGVGSILAHRGYR